MRHQTVESTLLASIKYFENNQSIESILINARKSIFEQMKLHNYAQILRQCTSQLQQLHFSGEGQTRLNSLVTSLSLIKSKQQCLSVLQPALYQIIEVVRPKPQLQYVPFQHKQMQKAVEQELDVEQLQEQQASPPVSSKKSPKSPKCQKQQLRKQDEIIFDELEPDEPHQQIHNIFNILDQTQKTQLKQGLQSKAIQGVNAAQKGIQKTSTSDSPYSKQPFNLHPKKPELVVEVDEFDIPPAVQVLFSPDSPKKPQQHPQSSINSNRYYDNVIHQYKKIELTEEEKLTQNCYQSIQTKPQSSGEREYAALFESFQRSMDPIQQTSPIQRDSYLSSKVSQSSFQSQQQIYSYGRWNCFFLFTM
ncbi:Hypothetical_protein [Hexamita inflata]|uniref:Hypothetical_protein n=1 Tax=Hexamita inflata TaxID=28002 RepID=A0AA86Q705_9EUKA|nr:Hypothetical protein HINF_LOCUS38108 [Hexamita inflata]